MDAFLAWLRTRGIGESFHELYRRGAEHLQALAGAGSPVTQAHVEAALEQGRAQGMAERSLANLRTIGAALIEFQSMRASRMPGRRCVLVVERDDMVGFDLEQELSGVYEVLFARTLGEAWSLLDERDADVCAIVSDTLLQMSAEAKVGPGARAGFQRPMALWERVPGAVRIIVSGNPEIKGGATMTGLSAITSAHAVLPSPWQPGTVREAIEQALAGNPQNAMMR